MIIVARKGSKRLKNKNFMYLGSKTLVERSIIFAKKLVENKNIILSTDSKKILEIGKENEILVPWLRPKNLSQDSSKSVDVALHALKWYEKNIKKKKFILLLQPTTPFRNLIFFKKALSTIIKNKKNNYVSVSPLKNRAQINKNFLVDVGSGRPPDSWMTDIWPFKPSKNKSTEVSSGYSSVWGFGPLREDISFKASIRGLDCSSDQIVTTSGANHAIDLIIRTFL